MTASAIRDVHAVLSGALQQAVVWGWRSDNPARLATRPAVGKAEVTPPQARQAAKLIETATSEDPELGLFLLLAIILESRRAVQPALERGGLRARRGADRQWRHLCARPAADRPGPDQELHQAAGSPSAPRHWSCYAATASSRRRPPSLPACRSPLTPTCSATSRTAPSPSDPMASPTGSPSSPTVSACTVACTTCGTSWSPNWSRPGWMCGRSPAALGTSTAAVRRWARTRTPARGRLPGGRADGGVVATPEARAGR
jgi:hypothetical protein